jgi:hypothetical protein
LAKDTTAVVDNASVEFVGTFANTLVLTLRNSATIGGTLRGNGTNRLFNGFSGAPTDNGLLIGTVPNGYSQSDFSILTGVGYVDLVIIPEPSALALVGAGLLLLVMTQRRRYRA